MCVWVLRTECVEGWKTVGYGECNVLQVATDKHRVFTSRPRVAVVTWRTELTSLTLLQTCVRQD